MRNLSYGTNILKKNNLKLITLYPIQISNKKIYHYTIKTFYLKLNSNKRTYLVAKMCSLASLM
jgi:hypothetical protein